MYLDVRTIEEWNAGHKAGALHIPLDVLLSGTLPSVANDTPLYVYCRSGARAQVACTYLESIGFTKVTNAGGFSDIQ